MRVRARIWPDISSIASTMTAPTKNSIWTSGPRTVLVSRR
jgi:hypothetical protein